MFSKIHFCSHQHEFVMLIPFLYSICVPGYFLKLFTTLFLSVGKLSVNSTFVLS